MGKKVPFKAIETTELDFKDKEEFLKWREKMFEIYEQSKIDYQEEINKLFGYDKKQD